MSSEEDQDTVTGNMDQKFGEVRPRGFFEIYEWTDKDRQTDRQTHSSQRDVARDLTCSSLYFSYSGISF